MFNVGDRVMYINASVNSLWLGWARQLPRRGVIYTVRGVLLDPHYLTREVGLGLWLEEIHNPLDLMDGREPTFCATLFRKVDRESSAHRNAASSVRVAASSAARGELIEATQPVHDAADSARAPRVREPCSPTLRRHASSNCCHTEGELTALQPALPRVMCTSCGCGMRPHSRPTSVNAAADL